MLTDLRHAEGKWVPEVVERQSCRVIGRKTARMEVRESGNEAEMVDLAHWSYSWAHDYNHCPQCFY
jgi:hypothetical protein